MSKPSCFLLLLLLLLIPTRRRLQLLRFRPVPLVKFPSNVSFRFGFTCGSLHFGVDLGAPSGGSVAEASGARDEDEDEVVRVLVLV